MKVRPVGHRVLVKPETVEEVSKGGIVIATAETKKQEQTAQVRGVVIDIGDASYTEYTERGLQPWCKVGDTVLYQKWAGMRVPDEMGRLRDDLLILNDTDITAVVEA